MLKIALIYGLDEDPMPGPCFLKARQCYPLDNFLAS